MFEPDEWKRNLENAAVPGTEDEFFVQSRDKVYDVVVFPIILGCCSFLFCMIFFILAVHFEWTGNLAPRCANRPKAVIKNALLATIPEKYRSNPLVYPIALVLWSYQLNYKHLIDGIPGTGTRKNGWQGPLLKTNVDGVVLLKFHTLLFKISVLVAILCTCVLLPINMTATCDIKTFGIGTCAAIDDHTNFIETTMYNIPPKFVSCRIVYIFFYGSRSLPSKRSVSLYFYFLVSIDDIANCKFTKTKIV